MSVDYIIVLEALPELSGRGRRRSFNTVLQGSEFNHISMPLTTKSAHVNLANYTCPLQAPLVINSLYRRIPTMRAS